MSPDDSIYPKVNSYSTAGMTFKQWAMLHLTCAAMQRSAPSECVGIARKIFDDLMNETETKTEEKRDGKYFREL